MSDFVDRATHRAVVEELRDVSRQRAQLQAEVEDLRDRLARMEEVIGYRLPEETS